MRNLRCGEARDLEVRAAFEQRAEDCFAFADGDPIQERAGGEQLGHLDV